MEDLVRGALPFVLPALLPALALLHLPLLGRAGHVVWALLLGAVAVLFAVDVAVFDHSERYSLDVVAAFGGADGEPKLWVVDRVTAPAWAWHVVVFLWFGTVAAWAWTTRTRLPQPPRPVATAVLVFGVALAARLALEKTAAPPEVVWATGANTAAVVIAVFFGWYHGALREPFGRLARAWLLAAVVQRVLLAAVALVATTRALGTHLDAHTVTEVTLPGFGTTTLAARTDAWLWTTLVPQLAFALPATFVIGLVLAAGPWWLAGRRARAGSAAPRR
jgi:hypothetical protein